MVSVFFSYIIIPLSTFMLARGTGYFSTNFSSIRTSLSRQGEFLLWSILTGTYFFFSLRFILFQAKKQFDIRKELVLLYLSAGMMFAFVATPYLPARFPLLSALHVFSALFSTVVLFFCLLFLAFKLYWTAPGKGRPCLLLLIATAIFCISSFILSGIINTAMEISFVLACCLLIRLYLRLFCLERGPDRKRL